MSRYNDETTSEWKLLDKFVEMTGAGTDFADIFFDKIKSMHVYESDTGMEKVQETIIIASQAVGGE